MAGVSNRAKTMLKQFFYDIVFDGALVSNTRASLVVELIKYFLYERQQIPLPLDMLKSQLDLEAKRGKEDTLELHMHSTPLIQPQGRTAIIKRQAFKSCEERKAKCLVSDITQMFEHIQKAFELCPEIEQVAVILGGTVVSPKESYVIKFPPPCPDADYLPLVSCKKTLFRQVISEDVLGLLNCNLPPTNMMLLISAPRSCPLKGFIPKQFLSSPKTGAVINFNFHCTYLVPICNDLTFVDEEFELSGIEPLQCTLCVSDGKVLNISREADNHKNHCTFHGKRSSDGNMKIDEGEFFIHSRLRRKRRKRVSSTEDSFLMNLCQSHRLSLASPSSVISLPDVTDLDDYSTDLEIPVPENVSCPKTKECESNTTMSSKSLVSNGTNRQGCDNSSAANGDLFLVSNINDLNISDARESKAGTDCIWYQSSLVIKGYRNQENGNSSIWA